MADDVISLNTPPGTDPLELIPYDLLTLMFSVLVLISFFTIVFFFYYFRLVLSEILYNSIHVDFIID